jgi:hypothetical protein
VQRCSEVDPDRRVACIQRRGILVAALGFLVAALRKQRMPEVRVRGADSGASAIAAR